MSEENPTRGRDVLEETRDFEEKKEMDKHLSAGNSKFSSPTTRVHQEKYEEMKSERLLRAK